MMGDPWEYNYADGDDDVGWTEKDLVRILFDCFVVPDAMTRGAMPNLKRSLRRRSIVALNNIIARAIAGQRIDPDLRQVIAWALTEHRLVPERRRRGRNRVDNSEVVNFIRGEIQTHPDRKKTAIYKDAEERFGLRRTQVREAWSRRTGPVRLNRE